MQEPDLCMTKQEFLSFCLKTFGVQPDYPFDGDTETAVLRHGDNRKWFGKDDGVFPAYHMNKLHWVSVLLPGAPDSIVELLADASYETTRSRRRTRK